MKTNNNIPAYRFQGYTDAWELRKLGEVGYAKSGVGFPEKEQGGLTGIPFFKVSDMNIDGNENELTIANNYVTDEQISRRKWRVITEVPAIFFAKVGAAVMLNRKRLIRQPFLLDNNTMTYIFNHSQWDSDFGKILFEKIDLTKLTQVGALPSYNSSDVENINIPIPTLPEQEAIGTFFSTLDQHITLHQRKLDTLKEQKKTYLKLLFPAKGQTKPALRFQGFEDDWKEVKLGELCDIRTGKLDANAMVENGEYDFYTSGIKKYRIDVAEFEGPAITIAGNGATVGDMHLADGKFNAYQRTYVLTNFKVDRRYIFSEIAKKLPIKIQQEARTGNIPYIVLSMLTELSISLPSLPEQKAIGTFFQTLDQEIAQVEDKLASLKEMKKTLLRKLFV
ncbi:TPA: restriction endonuclease subunit S [Streptococcus suis]|nr:restriction endonuclease subunit S [Streptococcus suis]HEM4284906.1 restriction endonuclease subunit S [Streptococcus suis]